MKVSSQSYLRQKRAKKKKIRLLLYCSSGAALVAAIFYFIFFSGYLNIREVSVLGIDAPVSDEIKRISSEAISGRRFLVPRGNILIFSSGQLVGAIENQFPVLDEVTVEKQLPGKIIIRVKEREKAGMVCGGEEKAECFYFDGQGVIFKESPEIISASLLLLKDDSVAGISLPSQKYDKKTVEFIRAVKKDFTDQVGIGVEYFHFINSSGDIAAHVDKKFEIYLASGDHSPEDQARILKSILDGEIKDKISALDYIDLRVDNRAYYKLRE